MRFCNWCCFVALSHPNCSQEEDTHRIRDAQNQALKLISSCCTSVMHFWKTDPSVQFIVPRLPRKCSFPVSLQSNYSNVLPAGGESLSYLVQSLELKVLLSVVSELSLLIEYFRRFSSICNKRNWTLRLLFRKLIIVPNHQYLWISPHHINLTTPANTYLNDREVLGALINIGE